MHLSLQQKCVPYSSLKLGQVLSTDRYGAFWNFAVPCYQMCEKEIDFLLFMFFFFLLSTVLHQEWKNRHQSHDFDASKTSKSSNFSKSSESSNEPPLTRSLDQIFDFKKYWISPINKRSWIVTAPYKKMLLFYFHIICKQKFHQKSCIFTPLTAVIYFGNMVHTLPPNKCT